ncbi:MAG: glycosyltransferase family 1 protein, partial [Actinomycetota bacterium]|nr:glycosyltransferase family 1 protein [Actinomycetota bacterium]
MTNGTDPPARRLRVAFDATPLLGVRTGVGAFTASVLEGLALRPDVDVTAFAVTWRGRDALAAMVPAGVALPRRPMAARPLRELWARSDVAPVEWWTGPVDVVHGTNFVVPPGRDAAEVVTVHDLTAVRFPELCTPDTLRWPALLRRALDRGA